MITSFTYQHEETVIHAQHTSSDGYRFFYDVKKEANLICVIRTQNSDHGPATTITFAPYLNAFQDTGADRYILAQVIKAARKVGMDIFENNIVQFEYIIDHKHSFHQDTSVFDQVYDHEQPMSVIPDHTLAGFLISGSWPKLEFVYAGPYDNNTSYRAEFHVKQPRSWFC